MQTEQEINSGSLSILKPRKALNKAFLKVKPNRSQIEQFKANLIQLLDRTNDTESEEFHKNLVTDFLKKTYYDPNHFINTKGRNDLVIHNGNKAKSSVGVIIEAKKPTNRAEMLTKDKINVKAFQELVLYYLRERITHKNLEIKYVIATNINQWFIFDANVFEKAFAQNKKLVSQFTDFEAGRLSGTNTDFFYKNIAEPFIAEMKQELEFTWFDINNYEKPLRNNNPKDDNKLIALYKLLSPEHLLKLPFTNDSNSLDKRFYGELLHIIGLTETKQGGKKLIERQKEGQRNTGSFLENAIIQLDSMDKIGRLENASQFGENHQERLFNVGLELSITWLNRILFLKLLEAQLVTYHKGDRSYEFLGLDRINNYDDLNSLFFQVLARQYSERNDDVKALFEKVPYLNSSLFEPTDIEHSTLFISNLRDDKTLPIYSATVLKDKKGKKRSGELNALEYLFEFLNAYDFSSEGGETIQEDNKTLINASVLGLIFEKINGYKDGSFFTPGFITMYMCRETIRKAVVQKFNEAKDWNCIDLDELYDRIEDRQEANELINSLKICDPAVGSGHFLVSALNEMIAIKNDLNILQDRSGRRLKEYQVEVVNDELIVTDEDGELFEYNPTAKESQRIQEALFHEKQKIIENCLFGVDINPNSVKICRLRLWIELLKNAYYKNETELETLPNIDINIKCGNSLISRFDLDADLSKALKKSKWKIDTYRNAVDTYRNAKNKEQKREMEKIIHDIKSDFRSEISGNDPKLKKLQKIKSEIFLMSEQPKMFEISKKEKAGWNKKLQKLTKDSKKLETEIQEIKDNKIYENAFEWRFEFPEVLDGNGDYLGFDVVIGNPPYVDIKALDKEIVKYLFKIYTTTSNRMNLYSTFVERGHQILKSKGNFTFIIPNSILMGSSYQNLRNLISKEISGIVKLPERVFEDATVETIIIEFQKLFAIDRYTTILYDKDEKVNAINNSLKITTPKEAWRIYDEPKFNIYISDTILQPLKKIHAQGNLLGEIADFTLGITPYDKYRGHSPELIKNKEFHSDEKITEHHQPLIKGENITPYYVRNSTIGFIKYGEWLGAPREERFFKEPRVIVRQIVSGKPPKIYAGFTAEPLYFTQIGFSIIPKEIITPLELTALLNSKVINFYHKYLFLDIEKELFQKILIENCKQFPCLPFADPQKIGEIVLKIIQTKKEDPTADTSALETEIDRLVYELYGLTEEEIGIVEKSV
ncbi:BREX-1 system adenine-specific DNA-methyltransferase PglX [Salegentibacter mishustinae]|uniref:DUF7149 domain-containing protein n=1 Tax=Salegentibacter mishustinae TaxID=270918 RepID=UPI001CE1C765|nr:DNA methyltransferase [Salegentibacter mishustinae]UBZ06381.1 BREX-1 system adenine-specific DNA-methyltransferase PglX [Salegentibacter mishustinae]